MNPLQFAPFQARRFPADVGRRNRPFSLRITDAHPLDPHAAAIELVDVSFAYDRRPVLRGITMTVPRGKVVAIMGGSGCGKTTILRLIGGQLRPQSGKVLVGGQSVPDLDAGRALRVAAQDSACCSSSARCSPT